VLDDHARTHLCGRNRHIKRTPSFLTGLGEAETLNSRL
jgi:hypothetical protein